jgi:flagellar hook protein FlgE
MMRAMFSAISGLKVHQTALDVAANDIANVNTIGYRSARTTFREMMSQTQRASSAPGATGGGSNAVQIGLGVQLGSVDSLMQQGALQPTGSPLDVSIQGDGWFRVGPTAPPAIPTAMEYTRAGNFSLNRQGYLVAQDGAYVVARTVAGGGGADALVQIPAGGTDVSIAEDGGITYVPAGGGPAVNAGYLSLAKFPNQNGLERTSGTRWIAGAGSGVEQVSTPGSGFGMTLSGTLEMSNVDLATQFTNMVTAQRGFQANSRVITASDEMLQELVNLKR